MPKWLDIALKIAGALALEAQEALRAEVLRLTAANATLRAGGADPPPAEA